MKPKNFQKNHDLNTFFETIACWSLRGVEFAFAPRNKRKIAAITFCGPARIGARIGFLYAYPRIF